MSNVGVMPLGRFLTWAVRVSMLVLLSCVLSFWVLVSLAMTVVDESFRL